MALLIRKLRLKFVCICMLLVTLVMGLVFGSVYYSTRRNIERNSQLLLRRIIFSDDVVGSDLFLPGGDTLQLPYFSVALWNDQVFVTGGTYRNLQNTEQLKEILKDCLSQNVSTGVVNQYQLRFLRHNNGLFDRIAFVDMSMERTTLQDLMTSYLQIGFIAALLLLGVSVLLSYWATKPVERALRQQRQFLSDASHELKTPLTVILSNAEFLSAAPLEDRPARWANNISVESRRMRDLVEKMLTLARADQMTHPPVFTEVSLSDTASDAVLCFEPVAFEAGKPLTSDIPDGVTVLGDAGRLGQVISILLDNAIKYGAGDSPIRLTLSQTERTIKLQVQNHGDTIPPHELSHLFERFYRADDSRGEQSGFGLGLSIASTIATEHKGSLKADSRDGVTTFTLTLPKKRI